MDIHTHKVIDQFGHHSDIFLLITANWVIGLIKWAATVPTKLTNADSGGISPTKLVSLVRVHVHVVLSIATELS